MKNRLQLGETTQVRLGFLKRTSWQVLPLLKQDLLRAFSTKRLSRNILLLLSFLSPLVRWYSVYNAHMISKRPITIAFKVYLELFSLPKGIFLLLEPANHLKKNWENILSFAWFFLTLPKESLSQSSFCPLMFDATVKAAWYLLVRCLKSCAVFVSM